MEHMTELLEMMTLARRHNSEGERKFVDNFILPLNPVVYRNPAGVVLAYVVEVGGSELTQPEYPDNNTTNKILFSSHVDTVHAANDPMIQNVLFDKEIGLVYKDDKRPLGADDAAGVWLMRRMIGAGVPGTYIFHRGEECGGIGSSGMAQHHASFLAQFTHAIAFDRRGQESIITEQMYGSCCSTDFALALGDSLRAVDPSVNLNPDDTGIFTDTANYVALIPECTNISVGYENEHSGDEYLDVDYLCRLTDAFIAVFSDASITLPVVREAKEETGYYFNTDYSSYHKNHFSNFNDFRAANQSSKGQGKWDDDYEYLAPEQIVSMRFADIVKYVRRAHPEDVADLLFDMAEQLDAMSTMH